MKNRLPTPAPLLPPPVRHFPQFLSVFRPSARAELLSVFRPASDRTCPDKRPLVPYGRTVYLLSVVCCLLDNRPFPRPGGWPLFARKSSRKLSLSLSRFEARAAYQLLFNPSLREEGGLCSISVIEMVSREKGLNWIVKRAAGGNGNERVDQAPETIVSEKEASSSSPQPRMGLSCSWFWKTVRDSVFFSRFFGF